jgi:SOS-response transcriptional repressor LexA
MFSISESSRRSPLTERQSQVYNYIVQYVDKNRIAPTYSEIVEACNLGSNSNAYRIVRDLITKKLIHKIGKTQESRQAYPIIDERYVRD